MPANIRVRCRYIDCKFLNGIFCGNTDIEVDPKKFCLAYVPIETEEPVEEEDDELGEDDEMEVGWSELEEEDDLDDMYTGDED